MFFRCEGFINEKRIIGEQQGTARGWCSGGPPNPRNTVIVGGFVIVHRTPCHGEEGAVRPVRALITAPQTVAAEASMRQENISELVARKSHTHWDPPLLLLQGSVGAPDVTREGGQPSHKMPGRILTYVAHLSGLSHFGIWPLSVTVGLGRFELAWCYFILLPPVGPPLFFRQLLMCFALCLE